MSLSGGPSMLAVCKQQMIHLCCYLMALTGVTNGENHHDNVIEVVY